MRYWLLELDVLGRTYRWAASRLSVSTAAGDTLVYEPGLVDDPQLALGEEVSVSVLDPSVDWTTIPAAVERAASRLLLWDDGTVYEQAVVYSRGVAMGPSYGPRGRLAWDIREDSNAQGLQIPDMLAVVDESTWPITSSPTHEVPEDSVGIYYPVILGYPGYVAGRSTPYPVVPIPIGQFRAASLTTTYYVAADRALPGLVGSDVYVQQVDANLSGWLTAATVTDLLGREVTVLPAGSTIPGSVSEKKSIYAGFSAAEGGGLYRGAHDVITWILREWGSGSEVDWSRMPESEFLNAYNVDTWINAPTRAWDWIEAVLLPLLPVTIQRSGKGRYLERDRYVARRSEALGTLDAGRGDWERQGDISWANIDVVNEFTMEYRRQRTGVWTARRILTAARDSVNQRTFGTVDERVSSDPRCQVSYARYGLRQSGVLQVPWTWDDGTVRLLLQHQAAKRALPYREVSGWVRDGAGLRTGDVYLLADDEVGLSSTVAIVSEPPLITPGGAVVRWRLPWETA